MRNNKFLNWAFICIEIILYGLIISDKTQYTALFSYFSIIVAFIYGMTFLFNTNDKRVRCIQIGLLFTLIADFFLVAMNGIQKEGAMISFSVTQVSYGLFLLEQAKYPKIELVIRGAGSLIILIVTKIVLKDSADLLSLVSMFYYFNILYNMVTSFFNSPSWLFKIGIVLFVCCDTVIGLEGLTWYMSISPDTFIYKIIHADINLAWVFYLPSQVLISYSINDLTKVKVNSKIKIRSKVRINAKLEMDSNVKVKHDEEIKEIENL